MKNNKSIVVLLTIIAALLAGNLIVVSASPSWAQDRPQRPTDGDRPTRPQVDRPDGERPVRPQAARRCVGITSVGSLLYVAFDDGTIERREAR
ncbi:MAG TPA: hypothetical protein PK400_00460 [Phycisphaerales bacterium]|nr:hypothetical protein [Phycisphaerales bacterium]HRQ74485.1 hypothetical protein [Phycisphaerales bacterium]